MVPPLGSTKDNVHITDSGPIKKEKQSWKLQQARKTMSLRNAVKRKTHKERSQPLDRIKLGLLEKHKDYVKRAKDYHKKQNTLFKLRTKAFNRNPDEFYFGMKKQKTKDGVHVYTNNHESSLSIDEARLLKTQDKAYLQMRQKMDVQKVEKLRESLHFIDANKGNNHTIFVDSEKMVEDFDAARYFNTAPELLQNVSNRLQLDQLKTAKIAPAFVSAMASSSYQELYDRRKRASQLGKLQSKLQVEKNMHSKGRKKKVQEAVNGLPPVYKWDTKRLK